MEDFEQDVDISWRSYN